MRLHGTPRVMACRPGMFGVGVVPSWERCTGHRRTGYMGPRRFYSALTGFPADWGFFVKFDRICFSGLTL